MMSMISYTTQKCTTFQTTSVFKNARSMQDIIELHTNFGYIVAYALQNLKEISDLNDVHLDKHRKKHCAEKPSPPDELQVVESQPTYINLDSDEDNGNGSDSAGESAAAVAAQQQATSMIRCKTVSEINTTATVAGPSKTLVVPTKKTAKKKTTVSKRVTAKKPELSESFVIDSSDSEAEVVTKTTADNEQVPDNDNQGIIEDILGEIINSLFREELEKENTPPNDVNLAEKEETPCPGKEAGKEDPVELTHDPHKASHEISLSCKETIDEDDRPAKSQEIKINGDIDESKGKDKSMEKDTSGGLEIIDKPVIASVEVPADDPKSTDSPEQDGPTEPKTIEEGNSDKERVKVSVLEQKTVEESPMELSVDEELQESSKDDNSCEIISLDGSMEGKTNEDMGSATDTASEVSAPRNRIEVVLEKEPEPMLGELQEGAEIKQSDAVANGPQGDEETDPFADMSDLFLVNEGSNPTSAATTECVKVAEKGQKEDVSPMETEVPAKPPSDVNATKPTDTLVADVLHNDQRDTAADKLVVKPIESMNAQETSLSATGSESTVHGRGESKQMDVDTPVAESAVSAAAEKEEEEVVAKPTENVVVAEQSMDDVFSAVESISKEIQRKEDFERGVIDTSK